MDITGIGSVADLLKDALDRFVPDKTKAAELKAQLDAAAQANDQSQLLAAWDNAKSQLSVDQSEGGSASLFVAGWRPFVGWICGCAFAYAYIVQPLMVFIAKAVAHSDFVTPVLDISGMMPVLLGMLGLGGMRTLEKVRGIDAGH